MAKAHRNALTHRVTISPIVAAAGLLAEAGSDAAAVLRAAGLDTRLLDDADSTITYAEMGRLLTACVGATGDESFALRVGLAAGPAALKALGFVALNTPTVRAALRTLQQHLHQVAGTIEIEERAGICSFDYSFFYPQLDGARLIVDTAMGLSVAMLQELCGPAWVPTEMRFMRPPPAQRARWQRLVHAPVSFSHERNTIVFQARWLDQRIERADPALRQLLLDKLAELEGRTGASDVERIATLVRSCVLAGEPTLEQVAGRLAISTATLKRRLLAAGTSFQELLDRTRFEMACHLLRDTRASMAQITDVLGYGHASTFTRAFGRWARMSPREWRERMDR